MLELKSLEEMLEKVVYSVTSQAKLLYSLFRSRAIFLIADPVDHHVACTT